MSDVNTRDFHTVRRSPAQVRLLALATLSMATVAGLMIGACSGAATGPTATAGDMPGKPELLQTFVQMDRGITVSWLAPAPETAVTGYEIRWRAFEDSWNTISGLSGNTTSYAIIGLETGVEYLIEVRASTAAGYGEWSDPLAYDQGKSSLFRAVSVAPDDPDDTGGGTPSTRAEGTDGDDYIYVEWDSEYYNHHLQHSRLGGDDRIWSGAGNDHLDGGEGNDALHGGGGDDFLVGGADHDYLFGAGGKDTLEGGSGNDELHGGLGEDTLRGGAGSDDLAGNHGDDLLVWRRRARPPGGRLTRRRRRWRRHARRWCGRRRFIFGHGQDSDTILDFAGVDVIDLQQVRLVRNFNDLMIKADGSAAIIDLSAYGAGLIRIESVNSANLDDDDFLFPYWFYGDEGDNTLVGDEDDNNIDGLAGNDTIRGALGRDYLVGGTGNDTLTGGYYPDIFVFAPGHGHDTITDFARSFPQSYRPPDRELDKIDLTQFPSISEVSDLDIEADGTTAVVNLTAHGGGTIRVERMPVADLDSSHFNFSEPHPAAQEL